MQTMTQKLEHIVLGDKWIESERGWGTRPDGYSLHNRMEDYRAFVAEYWASMPSSTPDEYSRPLEQPHSVTVTHQLYAQIQTSNNGIRVYDCNGIKDYQ
jgi:hypothetical protein